MNALAQDVQEDLMIQSSKTIGNVTFYDPMDALASMHNFAQSRMTPSPWAQTMRMIGKGRLKVGVKELSHHALRMTFDDQEGNPSGLNFPDFFGM